MAAPQLTAQVHRQLVELIAEDRPDGARLLEELRELRQREGIPACSSMVHLLAHLKLGEQDAEQVIVDLLAHREQLRERLGRDPGLRVAAIDFLTNIKPLLSNPTIVELSQLERTERSAITDDLTGLYNRRYCQSALEHEVRRSRRYVLHLSLVMMDLDRFKSVNDHYGHPFGDLVLQLVGRIMRRAVRESDLACRVGGEEFAVILPETDRLGAYAVAERIRKNVEKTFADKPIGGRAVKMTISGGVASYPEDGDEPQALVERADKALYRSKTQGRNNIVIYHAERRCAIRYPVPQRNRASLLGAGSSEPIGGHAINLSHGGALIELADGALSDDRVELRLERRGTARGIERLARTGRVVRVQEQRHGKRLVAIEFDQPLDADTLERHVILSRTTRGGRG